MTFYHGSTNPNLKVLKKNHSKDGCVYATTSRLVALIYSVKSFPNLFATYNGQPCFWELIPNIFEKMTKFKKGYIYILENHNFDHVELHKNKCSQLYCYRTDNDVQIIRKEIVNDIYSEFLKYQKKGEFKIYKFDEIPKEKRDKMIKEISQIAKSLSDKEINDEKNYWKCFV